MGGIEKDLPEKRTWGKRSESGDSKASSVSPMESNASEEKVKKAKQDTTSPKEEEKKTVKRTTRQNNESTELHKTNESSKTLEISLPEKRKLSGETESITSSKKIALSTENNKSSSIESQKSNVIPVIDKNTQELKKKKKLLGPKSQRKNLPEKDESDNEQE